MRLKAVALLSGLSLAAAANAAAVSPALVAKVSAAVDADAPRLTAIFNCGKAGSRWYRKRLKTTEINNLFGIEFSGTYRELPKNSWHDSPGIHQTFRADLSGWRMKIGHPVGSPYCSIESRPPVPSANCTSAAAKVELSQSARSETSLCQLNALIPAGPGTLSFAQKQSFLTTFGASAKGRLWDIAALYAQVAKRRLMTETDICAAILSHLRAARAGLQN